MSNTITTSKLLEIVQLVSNRVISQRQLHDMVGGLQVDISTHLSYEVEALVLQLMATFAADPIDHVEWSCPLNWWEHLKEAHGLQWFIDRWPIKRTRKYVDIKAIWKGYRAPPGSTKFGPFIPYVYQSGWTLE